MLRQGVYIVLIGLLLSNAASALETAGQREQRESFQKQLDLKFDEVNRKIGAAMGRTSRIREESKKEYTQLLDELRKKQEATSRKLREVKSADSRDWERLKFETNAAIEDLSGLYERLMSHPTKT